MEGVSQRDGIAQLEECEKERDRQQGTVSVDH